MKKRNPLSYSEVRRTIHRINDRIRYTMNTYGKDSAITKELVKQADKLIKGTGVALKKRKNGMESIPETEAAINAIISHNLKGSQPNVWRALAGVTTPKDIFKKLRGAYGKVKGKVSKTEEAEFLTKKKKANDTINAIIDKLMDAGVLGSDEVNEIFRDRVTGKRKIQEYLDSHPDFQEDNLEDLIALGEFLMNIVDENSGRNTSNEWGMEEAPDNSEDFLSNMTGKKGKGRKQSFKTSNESNPFGTVSKPKFVKPLSGWKKF